MVEHLLEKQDMLVPYLPRLAIQWLSESPERTYQDLEGSVAFVDISGFTKLSERLSRLGKVGAEELADAINTCFNRLLAVAYGNGGGLIKFGGDALLLFFSGVDHEVKASRAAIGMRRALREIGRLDCSGINVALRMSVGVHSGIFNFFLVGKSHREPIMTGPAASQTVLMESTAEAGEIVVSEATARALPPGIVGEMKGPGFLLRREPRGMSLEHVELEPPRDVDLVQCVPRAIREHLLAGLHEPEHRRVTVAFVHFDGTDRLIEQSGSEVAAAELERLVGDIQIAADAQDICFLASDIDRDGGKIILTAGAPVATGNDEERMLLALREIVGPVRAIPIRVGVNNGYVFCGDIGPSYRRTYTVMGDAVNLAARVMAKAQPGQILTTETPLRQSRTTFETVTLEPFLVKGKAKPVSAFALGPVSRAHKPVEDATVPLVGREHELQVLLEALDSARSGSGRVVEVIGEPGLGKSRLLEEVKRDSGDDLVLPVSCELYEASTPYGAFRDLLRSLLGIAEDATSNDAASRLEEVLAALSPDLLPWAPLIAIALDIEVPDTQQTRQIEQRFRRTKLNEVTGRLLARLLRAPTLFVFEDVHWMDEASSDLLRHLAEEVEQFPWFICVTRRDVQTGFTAPDGGPATRIRLEPLDSQQTAALLAVSTEDAPFRPDEIAALTERAGGNPLFLKELMAAARSAGSVDALPDSVEALIMARIDSLAPVDKNLLRHSSVLGRSFAPELLPAVIEVAPLEDDPVWERLSEFLVRDENGNVSFVHALIRDGAYEGLSYRLRRKLHARVGETIEGAAGEKPDEQAELLSLHFFHAQRYVEAWRYSLVAAERAKSIYANAEAAEFFERALGSARHVEDLVPLEIARVQESLGDVRERMGSYAEAAATFRALRRRAAGDAVSGARLLLKLSRVQGRLRRYSGAVRSLRQGLRLLEGLDGMEATAQRAQLMAWLAHFAQDQGRHVPAVRWSLSAVAEADRSSEKEALAHAYRLLDWAYFDLGQSEKATFSAQALALYEELGDLVGQAAVLNNLGVFAYWGGRWDEALDLYRRTREISHRAGDMVVAAFSTANIGEILSDQGRLEEAEVLFREALRVWQAAGYRGAVATAKGYLARVASRAGRYDEALLLFREAHSEAEDIGMEEEALDMDAWTAECLLFQGRAGEALSMLEEALERAGELSGAGASTPMLHRLRGSALLQLGELVKAEEALNEGLAVARVRHSSYEVALTLRAISRLAQANGIAASSDLENESRTILQGLGVAPVFDCFRARASDQPDSARV